MLILLFNYFLILHNHETHLSSVTVLFMNFELLRLHEIVFISVYAREESRLVAFFFYLNLLLERIQKNYVIQLQPDRLIDIKHLPDDMF